MTTTTITWHPVANSLPDDDMTVLLACSDGDVVSGFHTGGEWFDTTAWPLVDGYVTHWCQMPEPPA